ncbi:protein spaetzle 4 [Topomyia yanbarensis]|uniref:protein spaetzle 4 n=1 Tax=Topomyia yanbarensis TaxID=2498891 RepID=UPI00273AA5E1|nr:protein spaetzle 4 [Topomyia yanbarensis]
MKRHSRVELGIIHPLIFITFVPVITASGYGYDSASTCDPNASRKSRSSHLLQTIPCDLSVQAYCNLPGSAYPWHAVRRFVHENQGLMRRMYGDVRHISVLKSEMENNEIDTDDIHHTAERYSRKDAYKKMKHAHSSHYEFGRDKSNDVLTEPHFRPSQKISNQKTTTTTPPTTTIIQFTTSSDISITNTTSKPTFLSITLKETTTTFDEIVSQQNIGDEFGQYKDNEKFDIKKLSTIANLETNNETHVNADLIKNKIKNDTKIINATNDTVTNLNATESNVQDTNATSNLNMVIDTNIVNISKSTSFENTTTEKSNVTVTKIEVPNPTKSISKNTEGQLFQEAAQKEAPVPNMKGVNACPVKEEVVAPFWANNTRGEVLALLNLYPFEQYVHWEKCAFELKQMYCREGCRCEQQYRLHRLLAYDPHNECRGIFSDWFRFPSCCICKCYDLPFDYRVTSRSPRTIIKESIQYIEDELQNAIYDHATDDWYRPKDFGYG